MYYLFVSVFILLICVYEGLVNKLSIIEGSSDIALEKIKCRVSFFLVNYFIL